MFPLVRQTSPSLWWTFALAEHIWCLLNSKAVQWVQPTTKWNLTLSSHIHQHIHVVYWKSANHIWCTVLDLKWQPFIICNQTLQFPFSPRMKSRESAGGLQKSAPVFRWFYQNINKIWKCSSYYWDILSPYVCSGGREESIRRPIAFFNLKALLQES